MAGHTGRSGFVSGGAIGAVGGIPGVGVGVGATVADGGVIDCTAAGAGAAIGSGMLGIGFAMSAAALSSRETVPGFGSESENAAGDINVEE